jgi:hypothetical protein
MTGPNHIDLEPPKEPETAPKPAVDAPPQAAEPGASERRIPLPTTRQFVVMSLVILGAAAVAFVALALLPERFDEGPGLIVILLVAGLVALTLLLYLGTIIHRTAGVGTSRGALGMPEGSIRALIALSLVLMFAIIGVTVLYSGMSTGEEIVSSGLTSAQIDDLENVQIISISVVDPNASPGAETYNVTARPEISQAGHDFGLQLLTTVSTLVVAVAGFYFGSRAVAQGSEAALAAVAPQRTEGGGPGAGTAAAASGATGEAGSEGPGSEVLAENEIIGAVEDEAGEDDEGPEIAATDDEPVAPGGPVAADETPDDEKKP